MTRIDPIKALVGLEAELRILDAHIDKKFAHWTSLYGDRFSEIGNKAAENAYHEAVHAFAVASNRKTILAAIEALKRPASPAPVDGELVERVAIAIHLSEFPNWPWVDVEAVLRDRLRVKARAALAAIGER